MKATLEPGYIKTDFFPIKASEMKMKLKQAYLNRTERKAKASMNSKQRIRYAFPVKQHELRGVLHEI